MHIKYQSTLAEGYLVTAYFKKQNEVITTFKNRMKKKSWQDKNILVDKIKQVKFYSKHFAEVRVKKESTLSEQKRKDFQFPSRENPFQY